MSQVQRSRFKNGLTIVSEPFRGANGVSVGVFVRFGARQEPKGKEGIAHFLEHMLFKGTRKRTAAELVQAIESTGGEINAFTDREYTCFHLTVLKSHLPLAADILIDMITNSTFAKDELERERKVILQEILMTEESPEELAFDLFFQNALESHGLGRNILGTVRGIRKINRLDLIETVEKNFVPNNMVVAASGNISQAYIKKIFQKLARQRNSVHAKPKRPEYIRPRFNSGRWWVNQSVEQAHLVYGFPVGRLTTRERYALALLNMYLGSGMSSLLFQEIREKLGLAYTTYSQFFPFEDLSILTLYAATYFHQVNSCLRIMDECLQKLCDEELSKKQIKSLQSNLKGTLLLASDDVESRMVSLGRSQLFQEPNLNRKEMTKVIDSLTAEEIQRLANRVFRARAVKSSALVLAPRMKRHRAKRAFLAAGSKIS